MLVFFHPQFRSGPGYLAAQVKRIILETKKTYIVRVLLALFYFFLIKIRKSHEISLVGKKMSRNGQHNKESVTTSLIWLWENKIEFLFSKYCTQKIKHS